MKYVPAILSVDLPASSATDRAYIAIKRQIIELALEPGSHVTKTDLSRVTSAGAMPVREALTRLQRDGLVQALPRSGYRILPVTLKGTRDLCAFRRLLMIEAAGLTAERGCPETVLARMRELVETSYELSNPASMSAFLRAVLEVDALIANHCGNDMLAQSIVRVIDEQERVLRITLKLHPYSAVDARQRLAVLEALTRRDPAAAREAMHIRTSTSQDHIMDALLSSDSLAQASIDVP
ncbi:GntR family transcriptional regulator [Streptomyces chartreusis]|uniref:GntR family transcriptional regulator n=1 Tax=Streptomyces chartreusis TaxID=1969 RepID=UPI0037117990